MIYYVSITKDNVWNNSLTLEDQFKFHKLTEDKLGGSLRKKLQWLVNEGYLNDRFISVYEIENNYKKELIAWFEGPEPQTEFMKTYADSLSEDRDFYKAARQLQKEHQEKLNAT